MQKFVYYKRIPRLAPPIVQRAQGCSVADLVEAAHIVCGRAQLMDAGVRAVHPRARMAGLAITASMPPGDNLMLYAAVDSAQQGDALVLSSAGAPYGPIFGDTTGTACRAKGIAGTVADGAVRDLEFIHETGFPLWARHVSASHPEKNVPGSVNVPVVVGGVLVEPGDLVVGDVDGVVVLPRGHAEAIVDLTRERQKADSALKERIRNGESVFDIKGFAQMMEAKGVKTFDAAWNEGGSK
jgi:4-hydroxy-4-methyl-2-oxoglutarate aldolase